MFSFSDNGSLRASSLCTYGGLSDFSPILVFLIESNSLESGAQVLDWALMPVTIFDKMKKDQLLRPESVSFPILMCSESPGWTMSPRISFSHDLAQPEGIPIDRHRSDSTLLDSSPDFNFCINDRLQEESSSADELFSDGKILPILPRSNSKETCGSKPPKIPPVPPPIYPTLSETKPLIEEPKKESLREIIAMTDPPTEEKPPASKSFWRFTRSSSLNCGAGYKRSLICKLPLLNRSNSTGSVSQSSKKESSKSAQKQKPSPSSSSPLFPSITSSSLLPKPTPPALKKNERSHRPGAYGNGVRISPVLNVPPPYISTGTTNLFGFGYLFRTGKDGSKTKKKTATC